MFKRLATALLLVSPWVLAAPDKSALEATAMNNKLPLQQRVTALQALYKEELDIDRKVCIWDIGGRSGPIFNAALDQKARILEHGINISLEAYTSESILAEDLKSGICDAALITGLRARTFNKFAGTIDSIGGLPSINHMRLLLKVLNNPKMAPKLEDKNYVVLGVAPGGGAYTFVNDRKISSLASAAGKRIAVLDYDPTQAKMIAALGATPVPSNIVSAPTKFNNGVVDVLAAPLIAYGFMELHKGMTPNGGIVNYPLTQTTLQLIGRTEKFPTPVAQLVREAFYAGFDKIVSRLDEENKDIPKHWWIEVPESEKPGYENMMLEARLQLRSEDYYHAGMLKLQRKVRCKLDPSRIECTNPKE